MIKLNNPDHQEAKTFSKEELGNIVNALNIQFKDNPEALPMLQRLIDDYNHKVYFYGVVGGWEGLAKLQEIADRAKVISKSLYK